MLATTIFDAIEERARELQFELWDNQVAYWPGEQVMPIDVCDPWVAAHHLDFEVQEGWLTCPETRIGHQLGGFINRSARLIGISDQLKPRTMRFTLAHEIGHLKLHPRMNHHREIALHGLTEPHEPADPLEREANRFAGYFLVPTVQLRKAFRAAFGVETLLLTDDVAYELLGDGFMALMNTNCHSLAFERLIAKALRFRGRQFGSFVDLFQVSETTLAMRLRECGLTRR